MKNTMYRVAISSFKLKSSGAPGPSGSLPGHWTLQPPKKNGVMGLILLNSENCPVQDPGKGSGRERGSFSLGAGILLWG